MSSLAEQLTAKTPVRDAQVEDQLRSQATTFKAIQRFVRHKPLGTIGAVIVVLFILTAIFAPMIAPYSYDEGKGADRLQVPSSKYILGTDNIGRDMFSRIVWGSRISIAVGFGAVLVSTLLATLLGMFSGYWGGWFDLILQRFVDIWISFPALVLLIFIVTVFTTRNTDSLTSVVIVAVTLGVLGTAGTSRVIRSAVLTIRNQPYMEAARCIGCGHAHIIRRYVLPNVFAPILILATVQLGGAILAESTLSFLGFGVKPPMPAWGSMLSGSGRQYFLVAPGLAIWPGLAISLAVFGFNMLGDALRDVLDPRLRGSR